METAGGHRKPLPSTLLRIDPGSPPARFHLRVAAAHGAEAASVSERFQTVS